MVDLTIEQRVRERAYMLWLHAGQPDGRDDEFWQRACDEIEAEEGPLPPGVEDHT